MLQTCSTTCGAPMMRLVSRIVAAHASNENGLWCRSTGTHLCPLQGGQHGAALRVPFAILFSAKSYGSVVDLVRPSWAPGRVRNTNVVIVVRL